MTGAPYLAGFSRDVGFHCSFPLTLDSSDGLSGQHRWYPTSREKPARYGAPVLGVGTGGTTVCPQPARSARLFRNERTSLVVFQPDHVCKGNALLPSQPFQLRP